MEKSPPDNLRPADARGLFAAFTGLQCKATVLVVALTFSVTAAVSGYLLQEASRTARKLHDEELVQLARMVATAVAEPMRTGDAQALNLLAAKFSQGDPLEYVAFTDARGTELARSAHRDLPMLEWLKLSSAGRMGAIGLPRRIDVSPAGGALMDVSYPVQSQPALRGEARQSTLLGYVRVGMNADAWHRPVARTVDLVIGVGVIAVAIGIPLGFLLVRRIVSPIEAVRAAMDEFSEGRLEVRSTVRRGDEIGQLAEAFNRMADHHQKTHERIVRLNAELEERVARRTRQLHELASRDPLTGLYNRRHFNEMLERAFSQAARHDSDVACIMIDLDDFKAINDTFGHHKGDEVLMLVASVITSQLRAEDVAARLGGDEMIILLPQTDADRARILAERILEHFAKQLDVKTPGVRTGLSMGIASRRAGSILDSDAFLRRADEALYEAKQAGKNCIVTAEPVRV